MPCCCQRKPAVNAGDYGFVVKRKCRDVFCLVLFIAFCFGSSIIGGIGISQGNVTRLIHGTDYKGQVCGTDAAVKDTKYMAYPRTNEDYILNAGATDPTKMKFFGVCVDSCPEQGDVICDYSIATWPTTATNQAFTDCLNSGTSAGLPSGVTCVSVRSHCWITPFTTSSTMYRCIPDYVVTGDTSLTCSFPASITSADDPRCLAVAEYRNGTVTRPAKTNYLFDQINTARQSWGRWFGDLHRAWWLILVTAVGGSVVLGFTWLLLAKYFTGLFFWTTIILVLLGMGFLDAYFYYKAGVITFDIPQSLQARVNAATVSSQAAAELVSQQVDSVLPGDATTAYKVLAFLLTAVCFVAVTMVVTLRSTIQQAIKVIKMGTAALRRNAQLLGYPFLSVLGCTAFLLWWIFVAASLGTAGQLEVADVTPDIAAGKAALLAAYPSLTSPQIDSYVNSFPSLTAKITHVQDNPILSYLLIYHGFSLLWVMQFIHAIGTMTIAGVVGGWYFSLNESGSPDVAGLCYKPGKTPLRSSLGRVFRYYLGTAAFGSLLIAIMQAIRMVIAYALRRLTNAKKSNTTRFFACCVNCCLACIQALINLVTRNAFIYTAVKGTGFLASGKAAFNIIRNNATTLGAVNVLGEIVMFLAKVFISSACGWFAYAILDHAKPFQRGQPLELSSTWMVILVIVFFAYTISSAFFSVVDLSVDTVLVCYVTDMEETHNRTGRKMASHVDVDGMMAKVEEEEKAKKAKKGKAAEAPAPAVAAAAPVAPGGIALVPMSVAASPAGHGPRLL